MAAPVPAYYPQQQLDGLWSVYSADGHVARSIAGHDLTDIETLGDARNHILDLLAEPRTPDATQADFDAAAPDLEAALDAIMAEAA